MTRHDRAMDTANTGQLAREFTIRRAEARDMAAAGRLGALLVRLHHGFDRARFMAAGPGIEPGYASFLGSELAASDVVLFVAETAPPGADHRMGAQDAGPPVIVGYVYAGLEPQSWKELRGPAGFIHDVVVEEHARGRGIATALIERAARWLEDAGAPRVMLWTAEQNPVAQRLFQRLGFRRTMVEMTRERQTPGGG